MFWREYGADIYIEPRDPNVDCDEDSGDDDEGGLADNISSQQLRAGTEISISNNVRLGTTEEVPYHD